ncbi:MAG: hypothetical protein RLZZ337_296 [Bacteroidota bacterium]|jgi:predicted GNAT family N-acyltransferase
MKIEIAVYNSEWYQKSLKLRDAELRKPLGLNLFEEDLSDEENQIHFVALENEMVVGVVILVPTYEQATGKLRQMATSEEVRGKGYGKALVVALEEYAKQNGMNFILLHAREYAKGFYLKLGYEITSEVFYEVGIPHFEMKKSLM